MAPEGVSRPGATARAARPVRIRRRTLRTHSCHFIPCLRGVVFLCHSLSYLYVPGAAARRGSGPMTAAGRRGPRLCAAHGSRAEVVTRQAARSHLVTLRAEPPALRASIIPCTCSLHVSCHAHVSLLTGRCRPSRLPARSWLYADGAPRTPRTVLSGPTAGLRQRGLLEASIPSYGAFAFTPRRGPLCFMVRNYFRVAQPRAAAPPRSSEKNRCALVLTQCTCALRLHPVRFGCYPGHRVTVMTHTTCSPASSCLSVHTRLCKLLPGRDPSGVNP